MEWWGILLTAAGGVSTLGGAIVVIRRAFYPVVQANKRITANEQAIAEIQKHEKSDLNRFEAIERDNKAVLTALLALINNRLSGNSVDNLKAARDELEKHLINY